MSRKYRYEIFTSKVYDPWKACEVPHSHRASLADYTLYTVILEEPLPS